MRTNPRKWLTLATLVCTGTVWAATPPALVNYQGVLRNGADAPLTGSYAMEFRFFSLGVGGDEILVDTHASVGVSGGLFSVELGAGTVVDGAGPGTYSTLDVAFRDYASVWLEVRVGVETLAPRMRVKAAAYALNATNLAGKPATSFLDTSASQQIKAGRLVLGPLAPGGGNYGIEASGSDGAAYFRDSNDQGLAFLAQGSSGIAAYGSSSGGFFVELDDLSTAHVASGGQGIDASGPVGGGHFLDDNGTAETFAASGDYGIQASGNTAGGYFTDRNGGTGSVYLGYDNLGVEAGGALSGGLFSNTVDPTVTTYLATSSYGIFAGGPSGAGAAGAFSGYRGINAYGTSSGGYFADLDSSGYAYLASGDYGVLGSGNSVGGYFNDVNSSGWAFIGYGDRGIEARGTYGAGNTGEAGHFKDTGYTGEASVADGDTGIVGIGSFAGGIFRHCTVGTPTCTGTNNETQLATATSAISSAAPKNFVQNHPYDPTKIVVYTSLEGDEVGTYTRGTGRLEHGVGRIPLGKTFAWVTNPDIGLTAHVTPRGRFTDLYVESLSSTELVVRSDDGRGQDAVFDYVVMGLRIGFEEASVVRERDVDAYLPSMAPHEEVYRAHPELRSLNALERFRAMREGAGEGRDVDLSQSRALVSAIGVYDAAIHGAPKERLVAGAEVAAVPSDPLKPVSLRQLPPSVPAASELAVETGVAALVPAVVQPLEPKTAPPRRDYELVPAIGGIEPGDVVVLDPLGNGAVAASRTPADPLVVGCADAGAETVVPMGQVALPSSRVVLCRADASFGAIAVGDLLTTSPTPAHAMRASEVAPGAILGKAAEPLETGTALIRVVVALH